MSDEVTYCLDTNFFVEAWNKYYSPSFCAEYWVVLETLAHQRRVFIPQAVYDEIVKVDDDLSKWLKKGIIPRKPYSESVNQSLKEIYAKDERHLRLVDNTKGRSLADPWVIAHAIVEQATVVTKEEPVTDPGSSRIKIPNVCKAMGVRCINDFEFIREMNINFGCTLVSP